MESHYIILNGKQHPLEQACSVTQLLGQLGLSQSPVVVELNGVALPPQDFSQSTVQIGDSVEIVSIVAGG